MANLEFFHFITIDFQSTNSFILAVNALTKFVTAIKRYRKNWTGANVFFLSPLSFEVAAEHLGLFAVN